MTYFHFTGNSLQTLTSVKELLLPRFNFSKKIWKHIREFTDIIDPSPKSSRNILGQYGGE